MSRRKKPDARKPARRDAPHAGPPEPGAGRRPTRGILRDLAVLLLAFGAAVGVAELFGAANLGVAFGVGQIVFAIALVVLLTRD
jgi:hypothetical protein